VSDADGPSRPQPELEPILRAGLHAANLVALGAALGLPDDAPESTVACALVRRAAAQQASALLLLSGDSRTRERQDPSRVIGNRSSMFASLATGGTQPTSDIERIDDLRTLLSVVRTGSLYQRRAAVLRLGRLVVDDKLRASEQGRRATEALVHMRSFSIAYELWLACSWWPGADGRRARAAGEQWDELSRRFEDAMAAFWDGATALEPIAAMHDHERVQLLVRARDLSDAAARHLCALITGSDGVSDGRARVLLLGALQYAGDARLLPALRDALEAGLDEMVNAAARALGSIDDPRARAALKSAFERTAMPEQRLVLAGALGTTGDGRGLEYVRQVLASRDERLLPYALLALCELGGRDDVHAVLELVEHPEPDIVMAVVQTLGRIGDSRALLPLSNLASSAQSSALRAAVEDATETIAARMELLGEERPALQLAAHTFNTQKRAALVRSRDPAGVRMRARVSYWRGHLWLLLGAHTRAIARFETAAALRPDWVVPVLETAKIQAKVGVSAQALASFRRALGIDRGAVEQSATAVGLLATAFLQRADAMERDGRTDIAGGLVEEALSIDLRKAPSDLRFALEQRMQARRDKR
jgi:HEAT repeat protein